MKYAIRFYTRSGNTKKLADAVANEEFHWRGQFGKIHKDRPNAADLEEISAFAKKIMSE